MGEDWVDTEPQTQADVDEAEAHSSFPAVPVCWGRLIPLPPNKGGIIELRHTQVHFGKNATAEVRFDDPRIRCALAGRRSRCCAVSLRYSPTSLDGSASHDFPVLYSAAGRIANSSECLGMTRCT